MQKLSVITIAALAFMSEKTISVNTQFQGAKKFIPASDPSIWYTGRFLTNGEGSRSFDWEGAQMHLNVQGATYVKANINTIGGIVGRFIVEVDGWEVGSFYASDVTGTNEFTLAAGLSVADTHHIRLIQITDPVWSGTTYFPNPFVFLGFTTDGVAVEPTPRFRRIELIGDSISAGSGARGTSSTKGCVADLITNGNYYSYSWKLAEYFQADLVPIAFSGKGMYMNCCDDGETMPSYYQQTLAGKAYIFDWDFSQYTPDMLLINLGTNDMGKYSGTAWGEVFIKTYVDFVQTATVRY